MDEKKSDVLGVYIWAQAHVVNNVFVIFDLFQSISLRLKWL